ncbi:MAG: hypothetical protein FWG77_10390 [Treponema sp.]|nr:hypothetical protein [Treponema sp.]
MKNETPLSDMYILYMNGELSKTDFEGGIFNYLIKNNEFYRGFYGDRDYWNEFISWLYPRFSRAIDLYKDLGASFDAYMTGIIQSAVKEYRSREMEHKMTEFICWQARALDMMLFEEEPPYLEKKHNVFSLPKDITPKQVLVLLLKAYYFVSDEFIDRVAESIGMDAKVVRNMVEEIRTMREAKEATITNLRERLYCQHYRCLAYQKQLNSAQVGSNYYIKMKNRFERAKKRLYRMKKRLEGMRLSASNRMIAKVVGIPAGTVDSCLFAIKNRVALPEDMV